MNILFALGAGLLFGTGLILSGVTNPAKVLAFLDLAGAWDPSLGILMLGALLAATPAYALARRRRLSLLGEPLQLPTATRIDRRLLVGSLVFGGGWGLAGYCPGPAVASILVGGVKPLLFFLAMVAGMAVYELLEWRQQHRASPGDPAGNGHAQETAYSAKK
ncbi:YeeE/YedE family protein [Massilia sp. CFBP9026]|uniref:YeeE/YedE family protein n=1 Tax=Massilia sp. CFBP9026 TaxID=3096536 RepID=UPI002A6AC35B|nr:YeeE/YedE family protein [Massilia sp. CFBP9026]MDY0963730.1 YeeE/YedE family protein [Massilia sp. CFBP9026]